MKASILSKYDCIIYSQQNYLVSSTCESWQLNARTENVQKYEASLGLLFGSTRPCFVREFSFQSISKTSRSAGSTMQSC